MHDVPKFDAFVMFCSLMQTCLVNIFQQSSESQKIEERVVTIKRQPGGGLGISVKGGAEHGIPVLISRVFPGQAGN